MAAYAYQQNISGDEAVGYVKYNITPAFGTTLFPGDTIIISGVVYSRDSNPKDISLFISRTASGSGTVLPCDGIRELSGKQAVQIPFVLTATFPNNSAFVFWDEEEEYRTGYLQFCIGEGSIYSMLTQPVEEQAYTVVKRERLAPTVSNVTFTDDAGYLESIGGLVQGYSQLHISFTEGTDPLDTSLTIVKRVLEIGTYSDGVFTPTNKYELNSNDAALGVLNLSGELTYRLTVTDSFDQSGGNVSMLYIFENGAVAGYAWASNQFTRPTYTGTAGGAVNASNMTITMPGVTGSNLLSYNAHVCTSDTISVPAGASTLNVRAYKTTATATYLRFGMLPTNAANSYSTANGGQLCEEIALTTEEADYTLVLSDAVKVATNMKCIINARANLKNGIAKAVAVVTSVWFS